MRVVLEGEDWINAAQERILTRTQTCGILWNSTIFLFDLQEIHTLL